MAGLGKLRLAKRHHRGCPAQPNYRPRIAGHSRQTIDKDTIFGRAVLSFSSVCGFSALRAEKQHTGKWQIRCCRTQKEGWKLALPSFDRSPASE
jgi:hypothetical protein